METKELRVQAPEGYEIDKENSTLECIKFKPIHNPTYKDISNMLFNSDITDYYRINNMGKIDKYISHVTTFNGDIDFYFRKNIALYRKQLERLLSLNQLLNIAKYYNKIHSKQNNCCLYYVSFEKEYGYSVRPYYIKNDWLNSVIAFFNSIDDAQEVIDNPNFREILDTIYK